MHTLARPALRLLLVFALAAHAASAQAPDSSATSPAVAFAPVVVTATRLPLTPAEAPARVTPLRPSDADAAVSVADLLDARAPVVVRRYGPGGLATLSVRGASAAQTLVLLDGIPLASPALGVVDLSLLPTVLLDSGEVLSGSASGLWGSRAIGGVVALTSGADGGTRVRAEAGPWGTRRLSARAAVPLGAASLLVAGETAAATADYGVADGFGRIVPRLGWDTRQTSGLLRVGATRGRSHGRLLVWGATAERGLGADSLSGALVGERQWDATGRLIATGHTALGRVRVDATLGADASRLRWATPYPAPPDRADAIDETGRTRTLHADIRATAPAPGGTWTAGLAGGWARATHPALARDASDAFVAVALTGALATGAVRWFPSVRADRYVPAGRDAQTALSPHMGVNVRFGPRLHAKASAGRSFRMPTLNDRFWSPGGRSDLRPERVWAADVGVAGTRGAVDAEVTVFGRVARDEIVWAPVAGSVWSPENLARTRALGLEGSVTARRGALTGGAVATALHARDLDTGQPLRYQPSWTTRAWAAVARGGVHAEIGVRAIGARPTTASGSQPLPAHAVVEASVSVTRAAGPARFTLGLAAENLLDAHYASVRLHPMPPRHARLRLTVSTR